jgi:hypothetical protein
MPFKTIPALYRSIHEYLLQRIPDNCDSRLSNMIYLMMGIFQSGSVQLPLVARKLPLRAQKLSTVKRLTRFLENEKVDVKAWYAPFVRPLLQSAASGGEVRLILDATKVAFGFRLLMVSVAYRRRSLPVGWIWVSGSRGHTTTEQQLALLKDIRALLPVNTSVSLVGDGEFGTGVLMDYLHTWGWNYVLRIACDTQVLVHGQGAHWRRVDSWQLQRDTPIFMTQVSISQAYPHGANLLLFHATGEDKPWYLATNLMTAQTTLQAYSRRMWIEEMFGDMKGHGFDLENSHLQREDRLARLTLAVCLLYLWIVALGQHVHQHNLWTLIDRKRGDLSIFRWGWDFLERCLALYDPIPTVQIPNIHSVSGG